MIKSLFPKSKALKRALCLIHYKKEAKKKNKKLIKASKKEILNFEKDYPIFLMSLSSSVKCGLDPISAIVLSKKLFTNKSSLFKAIELFEQEINSGVKEELAISNFAKHIEHPDVNLFREALILSRQEGASLSASLQRIARVVRTRQSFRRKAKSAIAMQKLSAIGISIAVGAMLVIQIIMSGDVLKNCLGKPLGLQLLLSSLILILVGITMILNLSRKKYL